jgi:hypothetical protein
VTSTAIAGGKALSRDEEGRGVGSKIEEELRKNIESEEGALGQGVVGEANDAEDDGQDEEAPYLDRPTADGIDERDGHPVTWDGSRADKDEIADGIVAQDGVDVGATGEADGGEDRNVIEAQAIVCKIEEEPGRRISMKPN